MSHLFEHGDVAIYHDNDLDGTVRIVVGDQRKRCPEVVVPVEALLEFVAHLVETERVSAIERMSPRQLLGLPEKP